jgi:ankyrin repeat protein
MRVIRDIGVSVVVLVVSLASLHAASSPVADAAMKGDRAGVQKLLAARAEVNAPQADGARAIHWAVYRNDAEMLDLLVRAGADVTTPNREGATPLSLACVNGNPAVIRKLLDAGADANERGPHGETALMMAARTGDPRAVETLIDWGADVNARETLRGTTALMWAAAQEHPSAVQVLLAHGAEVGARSSPGPRGRTAYLAPTARQRAAQVVNEGRPRERGAIPGSAGQTPTRTNPEDRDAEGDPFRPPQTAESGGLTALVFAARQGDLATARLLLDAGAKIDQTTQYGWTALLAATQNRNYILASYLLDRGADPNIANKGGWTPLYLATDNRNIEGGDYPARTPDMDHLEFIKKLLERGANVNARAKDSTETRTIFTMQWLYEDGATPFLRASQSGDLELMKLLLAHGADPKIPTANNDTALSVAAGIGWVEGVTYESSAKDNLEAVKMLLDIGLDVNAVDGDGRTALHGAAHKGRNAVVQLLVDHGAKLDARDLGSRDTVSGELLGHGWLPVDYADGLVRVGVQSALPHPETATLLRKLMGEAGLPVTPPGSTTVCVTAACR